MTIIWSDSWSKHGALGIHPPKDSPAEPSINPFRDWLAASRSTLTEFAAKWAT
jgi:hypothetical protein